MPRSYGLSNKPGFIIRFAEADLQPQTYDECDDGWQAVSIGEDLIHNSNAETYCIIDRVTGKICWGNI